MRGRDVDVDEGRRLATTVSQLRRDRSHARGKAGHALLALDFEPVRGNALQIGEVNEVEPRLR